MYSSTYKGILLICCILFSILILNNIYVHVKLAFSIWRHAKPYIFQFYMYAKFNCISWTFYGVERGDHKEYPHRQQGIGPEISGITLHHDSIKWIPHNGWSTLDGKMSVWQNWWPSVCSSDKLNKHKHIWDWERSIRWWSCRKNTKEIIHRNEKPATARGAIREKTSSVMSTVGSWFLRLGSECCSGNLQERNLVGCLRCIWW